MLDNLIPTHVFKHKPREDQEGLVKDIGRTIFSTQMIYRQSNNSVQGLNSLQLSSTCTVALVNAALWFGEESVVFKRGKIHDP